MLTKALAILALTSGWTIAQTAGSPPPRDPPHSSDGFIQYETEEEPDNRSPEEALRDRLTQTLAFAQRIVETHQAALAELDAGEDPREILRQLRSPELRGGMRVSLRAQPNPDDAHGHGPAPVLTDRELRQVREFISQYLPQVEAQLQRVEESSPEATDTLTARLSPKVMEILRLRKDSPQMADLKIVELRAGLDYVDAVSAYRSLARSVAADRNQLNESLDRVRKAASMRFDAQVLIKQFEIHQLTLRIEELHEALDTLSEQRTDQVEAQVHAAQRMPRVGNNRRSKSTNDRDE